MEGNVIGTLVINYDKLSKLETEGKKISKYKEEYEYQLEKNIITSLRNVTDEYSSNINDAESYLKYKIAALNEDSEQMMDFLKQVNELLELADAMDREVAALYQDNMERLKGISSKVGGYDGFWSIFRFIGDGMKAIAYSYLEFYGFEDIYTDLKTKLRYWYECDGGKELLKIVGQGILLGLEVAGLVGAVLAIGTVGPIIGACAIVVGAIGVANGLMGVSNSIKAFGYAKSENPAMARLVGDRTTVADELRAHNFGSGLLNDVSNFAAMGIETTELVLSVVCFSADAKLLKKGKEALSSIGNFAKHSSDNILGTLKKIPQKGGNLKDTVKAGYNNGKRIAKELGGEVVTKGKQAGKKVLSYGEAFVKQAGNKVDEFVVTTKKYKDEIRDALTPKPAYEFANIPGLTFADIGSEVSSASKNTDTIMGLKKMDISDNLGSVGDVKNSDVISNVTGGIDDIKVKTVGRGGSQAVDVELKYKDGWTAAQKAEADAKVKALTEANTVKTPTTRRGTSASSRYKSAYGNNSVPSGYDVDHTIDLQLGGADDILNMNPLDMSVNRSLGVQIKNAIKDYDVGTVFGKFTIK